MAALDRNPDLDPLERYLKAVRGCLPKQQQDDIVNELRGNIGSQIEDQEAKLGRPLSREEQTAILKHLGHPILIAGRYRSDQRSVAFGRELIGPALYPFYARVLWINVVVSLALSLSAVLLLFMIDTPLTLGDVLNGMLRGLVIQFGVVTFIFAFAQKNVAGLADRWDPRDPMSLRAVVEDTLSRPAAPRRVPRFESFAELVAVAIVFMWLLAAREGAHRVFGAASAALSLAPVWHQVVLPILALPLVTMAQDVVNLARPQWTTLRSAVRVFVGAAWLAILLVVLKAEAWFVLGPGAGADGPRMLAAANQYCLYSLAITVAASAISFGYDVARLTRRRS